MGKGEGGTPGNGGMGRLTATAIVPSASRLANSTPYSNEYGVYSKREVSEPLRLDEGGPTTGWDLVSRRSAWQTENAPKCG